MTFDHSRALHFSAEYLSRTTISQSISLYQLAIRIETFVVRSCVMSMVFGADGLGPMRSIQSRTERHGSHNVFLNNPPFSSKCSPT